MARRYGRNQRRAHRETITRQEREIEMAKRDVVNAWKRSKELEQEMLDWDEEIRRLLGDYSAFRRQTPELATQHSIREMPARLPTASFLWGPGESMTMTMTEPVTEPASSRISIARFVASIDHHDLRMETTVRFREVNLGKGESAYCISDSMLAWCGGMGKREVQWLAHEIAKKLVAMFNERTVR